MDRLRVVRRWAMWGLAWSQLLWTAEAQAGPLFDWLFLRRSNPATTAYYNPAAANTAGCCGPGTCEQTVVQYLPQVAYRTVWEPVPVTSYRRTVSYNPANGLPMTCTQPCTTYTYQARRVPYTTFRPVYATVPVTTPGNCQTVGYAAAPAAPTGCGCGSAAPLPNVQAAPMPTTPYASPGYSTTNPGYTSQGTPTPWEPVNPSPSSAAPSRADRRPPYYQHNESADPGSSPPAIDPNADVEGNYDRSSSYRGYPSIRANRSLADDAYADRSRDYRTYRSDDSQPRATDWSRVEPSRRDEGFRSLAEERDAYDLRANDTRRSLATDRSSNSRWENELRATSPSPAAPTDIRPIPNPDLQNRGEINAPENQAPPLLNDPRDRTALVRPIPTQWAANRIAWPAQRASYDAPSSHRDHSSQASQRRLDPRGIPSQRFESHRPSQRDAAFGDNTGWRPSQR